MTNALITISIQPWAAPLIVGFIAGAASAIFLFLMDK